MKMKRGLGTGRTAWINAATLLALIDRIFWSTRHVNGTQAKEMHLAIPEVVCDPLYRAKPIIYYSWGLRLIGRMA